MFKGRKIFFKNIGIDYLVCVLHQKKGSTFEENDGRLMVPGTKAQRNT